MQDAENLKQSLDRLQSQKGGEIADNTVGTFCTVDEYSEKLSAVAGEPVYVRTTYCDVRVPGNAKANVRALVKKDMPDGREIWVSDEKPRKYPRAWDAFLKGEDLTLSGTALEDCAEIPKRTIPRLRAADIQTVEELANLPDRALQRIGMDGRALQRAAQNYVSEHGQTERMATELEQLRAEVEQLKAAKQGVTDGDSEDDKPKRRGRPRRKSTGDDSGEHRADSTAAA